MYAFRRKYNPEKELENLNGKVALVTGGSNGLGYWTCQWLVRRGAKVYMGARSESKAKAAIEQLTKEGLGNLGGEVIWHECDLSHPKLAKESGDKFREREDKLHILINNAAIGMRAFGLDAELGVQDVVVVNHLGPAALIHALLPLFEATAKADPTGSVRIIYVGTEAHKMPKKVDTLVGKESFNVQFGGGVPNEFKRYGFSKLLHIMYTRQFQSRLSASSPNIIFLTADPGGAVSGGVKDYFTNRFPFPFNRIILGIFHLITMTPSEASMTSAYAAASKTIEERKEKYKGEMVVPYGSLEEYTALVKDEKLGKELWETTEQVLREAGAL